MVTLSFRRSVILRRVFIACVTIEILLVLLDYHITYGRAIDIAPIRNLFNMTREDALGSWLAVTQTLLVALTLWWIVLIVRAQERSRFVRFGWLALALFFSYMALDDGSELHERMGSAFKVLQADDAEVSSWFPSYPWQVLFVPVFASFGLFMLLFLWRELRTGAARLRVLIALGCFAFAVGLDFIEGLDRDHDWNLYTIVGEVESVDDFTRERFNRNGFTALRHFGKSVEEATEMFGMTLFWITFLGYAMQKAPDVQIRFAGSGDKARARDDA